MGIRVVIPLKNRSLVVVEEAVLSIAIVKVAVLEVVDVKVPSFHEV